MKMNSSAWELHTQIHKIYVPLYLFKIVPGTFFCGDAISQAAGVSLKAEWTTRGNDPTSLSFHFGP